MTGAQGFRQGGQHATGFGGERQRGLNIAFRDQPKTHGQEEVGFEFRKRAALVHFAILFPNRFHPEPRFG